MDSQVIETGQAAMFELKPTDGGLYVLEAYGLESMPFELEDLRSNKEWFSKTINSVAEGTVQ